MLLSYPCLAPHHPLSGTSSSHVWNLTCIWYTITCIWYTTTYIWYTTTCIWYPTIPVWYPTIPIWYHTIAVWYPTTLLEPHPYLEPHYVSRNPPPVWYPTPVPHFHHLACSTPLPSGHCCSYLTSNCPLPPDLAHACSTS